jgi:hypothetical protein
MILYALLWSELVVKGTPNSVLGGEALGNQYCEIVVNVVLKRDTCNILVFVPFFNVC